MIHTTTPKIISTRLQKILAVYQPEQRTSEWYAQREHYLTSSDLGSVLGLCRYQTREDTLLKKAGLKKFVIDDDTAIRHGQTYEAEAIALYCELTGRRAYDVGLVPYTALNERTHVAGIDCSFIAGSADGVTVLEEEVEGDASQSSLNVLEVKCPYRRWPRFGEVPEHYYPQLQMNLHILNVDVGEFIEYFPAGLQGANAKMNIVRVYRDEMWLRYVIPELRAFWDEVLEKKAVMNSQV